MLKKKLDRFSCQSILITCLLNEQAFKNYEQKLYPSTSDPQFNSLYHSDSLPNPPGQTPSRSLSQLQSPGPSAVLNSNPSVRAVQVRFHIFHLIPVAQICSKFKKLGWSSLIKTFKCFRRPKSNNLMEPKSL